MTFRIGHNKGPAWAERVHKLTDALRCTEPGQLKTYADLSTEVGFLVDGASGALQRALRRLQGIGVAFTNSPGEGYRRLDSTATVTVKVRAQTKKAHRALARGLKLSRAVPDECVSRQARPTKWALEGALQAAASATHGNSLNKQISKKASALDEARADLANIARGIA